MEASRFSVTAIAARLAPEPSLAASVIVEKVIHILKAAASIAVVAEKHALRTASLRLALQEVHTMEACRL